MVQRKHQAQALKTWSSFACKKYNTSNWATTSVARTTVQIPFPPRRGIFRRRVLRPTLKEVGLLYWGGGVFHSESRTSTRKETLRRGSAKTAMESMESMEAGAGARSQLRKRKRKIRVNVESALDGELFTLVVDGDETVEAVKGKAPAVCVF